MEYRDYSKGSDYEAELNVQDLLTYEMANNWLCQWITWDWLQTKIAVYMVRKVQRKHRRFVAYQAKLKKESGF